jgi:hypothetical protein
LRTANLPPEHGNSRGPWNGFLEDLKLLGECLRARERLIQARVLTLLVGLQLRLQLGPELAPGLGSRLQYLLERGFCLLVFLLEN